MRNWAKFLKPSEYYDDKASNEAEQFTSKKNEGGGSSIEKTPKQRVDEYRDRYGNDDEIERIRTELKAEETLKDESEHDDADEIENDLKNDELLKDKEKHNVWKLSNTELSRVTGKIDYKRQNKYPKGGDSASPRDIDGARKASNWYDRIWKRAKDTFKD